MSKGKVPLFVGINIILKMDEILERIENLEHRLRTIEQTVDKGDAERIEKIWR